MFKLLFKSRPIILLAVLFLGGTFSGFAQTGASSAGPRAGLEAGPLHLSPDDAVELAIGNNLLLEMARIESDIQRRGNQHAWNRFLPTLDLTGSMARENFGRTVTGMVPVPIPGAAPLHGVVPYSIEVDPMWVLTGNFSAQLLLNLALFEGVRSARLEYEGGLITLNKARLQIEQNIRKIYNTILLMEAQLALQTESFTNLQRQAAIAEANFQAGMAPRLTMLQAQVQLENMRPVIHNLESTITNTKGNFSLLLGLPFDTEFILEPLSAETNLIPDDLVQFISRSSAMAKPDIMELQANINTMHSQRRALAYQRFMPNLILSWNISSTMMDPVKNDIYVRDNWNDGGNFSIALRMSLNSIFNFTQEGQRRADFDARLQQQNIRLAQMIRETELEIFTKLNSLQNSLTTMEVQQETVNLAELTYRLTEEAYRAGHQDLQAVQNAGLNLEQARFQLLSQQFTFLNDLIDLEYSLGVPFGTLSSNGTLSSDEAPSSTRGNEQ